jgi:hypothetical protein
MDSNMDYIELRRWSVFRGYRLPYPLLYPSGIRLTHIPILIHIRRISKVHIISSKTDTNADLGNKLSVPFTSLVIKGVKSSKRQ